jgi:hypothetical protein
MRSRTQGMWWGPAVEAPDPGALAQFYSALLDWPVVHEEPGTTVLAALTGPSFLVFQQATDYRPPVWPPVDGEHVRVLLDPAGHPFCLVVEVD